MVHGQVIATKIKKKKQPNNQYSFGENVFAIYDKMMRKPLVLIELLYV